MITLPQVTVVAGQQRIQLPINDAASCSALVLKNESAFDLQCQYGGGQNKTVAAWTSDLLITQGRDIALVFTAALNLPNTVQPNNLLTINLYGPTEPQPDAGAYPQSLTRAMQTTIKNQLLGSLTLPAGSAANQAGTYTLPSGTLALQIFPHSASNSTFSVTITDSVTGAVLPNTQLTNTDTTSPVYASVNTAENPSVTVTLSHDAGSGSPVVCDISALLNTQVVLIGNTIQVTGPANSKGNPVPIGWVDSAGAVHKLSGTDLGNGSYSLNTSLWDPVTQSYITSVSKSGVVAMDVGLFDSTGVGSKMMGGQDVAVDWLQVAPLPAVRANYVNPANGGTILAAPGAGLRYLVYAIAGFRAGAADNFAAAGLPAGGGSAIFTSGVGFTVDWRIFPSGIIAPVNTAIVYNAQTVNQAIFISIIYSIITTIA